MESEERGLDWEKVLEGIVGVGGVGRRREKENVDLIWVGE